MERKWRFMILSCCIMGVVAQKDFQQEFIIGVNIAGVNDMGESLVNLAVDYVNSAENILPNTKLVTLLNTTVGAMDTVTYFQNQCYQLDRGAHVLIGPESSSAVKATYPVLEALKVPLITPFATDDFFSLSENDYPFMLKMSAPERYQIYALADLAEHFQWTRIAVVASNDNYGITGAKAFTSTALARNWPAPLVKYFNIGNQHGNMTEVSESLQEIKENGINIIVLYCLSQYALEVMNQAKTMEMTEPGWAWLVPEGVTSRNGFVDPCAPTPEHLIGVFGTKTTTAQGSLYAYLQPFVEERYGTNVCKKFAVLPSTNMFDAVLAVAYALHDYIRDAHALPLSAPRDNICSSSAPTATSSFGNLFMQYLQQATGPGTMHDINFTSARLPVDTDYDIMNLQENGWEKVGRWSSKTDNKMALDPGAKIVFQGSEDTEVIDSTINLEHMMLKIVTVFEPPFTMISKNGSDEQYEGFCMDLLEELQSRLNFQYELHISYDGMFGTPMTDAASNQTYFTGMVGEIIDGRADVAIASLTITHQRQEVIDFTTAYLDLGVTFIVAKEAPNLNLWAFMSPFEPKLWTILLFCFIACSVASTCCSHLSPFGFRGRYTQRLDRSDQRDEEEKDILALPDSAWFAFGAWMTQGQEISPSFLSGRVVTGFWWITVMVVSATYTANLAAFLTVARFESDIDSVESLSEQSAVRYGTTVDSPIETFLESADTEPFRSIAKFMNLYGSSLSSAEAGIKKVLNGYGKSKDEQYAFIYDSAPLEYAVATSKNCILETVGQLFNQFGYGLALKKNSPLTEIFSLEILKLRQEGYIEQLRSKWFPNVCTTKDDSGLGSSEGQATLQSMSGIFYLYVVGLTLAFKAMLMECLSACRNDVREIKTRKILNKGSKIEGPHNMLSALWRRLSLVVLNLFCDTNSFGNADDASKANKDTFVTEDIERAGNLDVKSLNEEMSESNTKKLDSVINNRSKKIVLNENIERKPDKNDTKTRDSAMNGLGTNKDVTANLKVHQENDEAESRVNRKANQENEREEENIDIRNQGTAVRAKSKTGESGQTPVSAEKVMLEGKVKMLEEKLVHAKGMLNEEQEITADLRSRLCNLYIPPKDVAKPNILCIIDHYSRENVFDKVISSDDKVSWNVLMIDRLTTLEKALSTDEYKAIIISSDLVLLMMGRQDILEGKDFLKLTAILQKVLRHFEKYGGATCVVQILPIKGAQHRTDTRLYNASIAELPSATITSDIFQEKTDGEIFDKDKETMKVDLLASFANIIKVEALDILDKSGLIAALGDKMEEVPVMEFLPLPWVHFKIVLGSRGTRLRGLQEEQGVTLNVISFKDYGVKKLGILITGRTEERLKTKQIIFDIITRGKQGQP